MSEKFEYWVQLTSDAVLEADHSGCVTFWNAGAEAMFGYTANEVLGKSLTILMPESYVADHQAAWDRFIETPRKPYKGKPKEFEGIRKDGTVFPLELTVCAWEAEGQWNFGAIIRDITSRRMIERKMQEYQEFMEALFESIVSHMGAFKALKQYFGDK